MPDVGVSREVSAAMRSASVLLLGRWLRGLHHQDRDSAGPEDLVGHAADRPPRDTGPAVAGHDDDVTGLFSAKETMASAGSPVMHLDVRGDSLGFQPLGGSLKVDPGTLPAGQHSLVPLLLYHMDYGDLLRLTAQGQCLDMRNRAFADLRAIQRKEYVLVHLIFSSLQRQFIIVPEAVYVGQRHQGAAFNPLDPPILGEGEEGDLRDTPNSRQRPAAPLILSFPRKRESRKAVCIAFAETPRR